ncbi:sortase A [Jatrophihabitans endophyticus]|uniref:Sortase A n=1 Tax=Jatrophihabitans endophyticus TaxID=1206085 RepID=A0A1M5HXS4_9ACTN|nr:class E sortase [Jatrophihabitans endophyticus]SHG20768.1 sortase A [Jatrophihabitans endophyticus]
MDDTMVEDPPPAASPEHTGTSTADKVRFVLRGIGQTLITLGLVVLLFVVYEVWVTNIYARGDNDKIAQKLERTWEDPTLDLPGNRSSTIPLGTGVANIYIPRLGSDYHWTIVEGTGLDELDKGPGHYTRTAMPGQVGNFGVAGHRVGKGEPFLNLDKLRVHDAVVVETRTTWYVYRVLGSAAGSDPQRASARVRIAGGGSVTVPGREIVPPSAGRVLLPVPNHENDRPVERLMTMTTCHPKFTAAKRMIVHAEYAGKYSALDAAKKHVAAMPAPVRALYSEVSG